MKKEKSNSKKKLKLVNRLIEQKSPHWIVSLVAEAILLMLSVLFALVLNEKRAEIQRNEDSSLALQAITSEIRINIKNLDRAIAHHLMTTDTLSYYDSINTLPPPEIYIEKGLFQPADLFSTAWETSIQTGVIDDFSYNINLEFSRVYKDQNQYEKLGDQIVQETYIKLLNEGPEKSLRDNYKNWSIIVWDFSNREKRLKEKLEVVLYELERFQD